MRASAQVADRRWWFTALILGLTLSVWLTLGTLAPPRQMTLSERATAGQQTADPGGPGGGHG